MVNIAVLGGSSPTTPVLIKNLAMAVSGDHHRHFSLRLHGRNENRLGRIVEYAAFKASEMGPSDSEPIDISGSPNLANVLPGADIVVFQVRPGGMRFRGIAESTALAEGLPGDEGLGPGGLACYLRGRPELDELFSAITQYAPDALILMMTSPLGLAVERARSQFGLHCVGVCELSHVTLDRLTHLAKERLQLEIEGATAFGLNHASWLYGFRDQTGNDVTGALLDSGIASEVVGIDADIIRRERAVPVHYLRQIYCADKVVKDQRVRVRSRGAELANWRQRFHTELVSPGQLQLARIDSILEERRVDWYSEGLVPAILSFTCESKTHRILNVSSPEYDNGIPGRAVLEVPCKVANMEAIPIVVPPLPVKPRRIFRELLNYELHCQQLPEGWQVSDIMDVLMLHPSISCRDTAHRLASKIKENVTIDLEQSEASSN